MACLERLRISCFGDDTLSSRKTNAAPLKLFLMHGAQRLLVLAKDLYVKSALTIASLRASPHETDHAHRWCDVSVAGDVFEL